MSYSWVRVRVITTDFVTYRYHRQKPNHGKFELVKRPMWYDV